MIPNIMEKTKLGHQPSHSINDNGEATLDKASDGYEKKYESLEPADTWYSNIMDKITGIMVTKSEAAPSSTRPGHYTIEQAIETLGFGIFQWKLFFVVGLLSMTDALQMIMLSLLDPPMQCDWLLPQWKVAFVTIAMFIGTFFGNQLWGKLADKYGRQKILLIAVTWLGYFGLLSAGSPIYPWFIILRMIFGIGFGGVAQAITLMSEFTPCQYRGKMFLLFSIMWSLGSIAELIVAYWVIPVLGWRGLIVISTAPTFITLLLLATLPESARYLLASGRTEEAEKILQQAAIINKVQLPYGRLEPVKRVPLGSYKDLFSGSLGRSTLQLWFLWFGTYFIYYGVILTQTELLETNVACHLPGGNIIQGPTERTCMCYTLNWDDYKSMAIATFGEFVSIPVNLLAIDTLGRRYTIALNYAIAGLFYCLVQICLSRLWMTSFIFIVRAFSSATGILLYIYTTELYPTTLRALAVGSAASMSRIGGMLTPLVAQVVLTKYVHVGVWIYGILSWLCALAAALLPVETYGREMSETKDDVEGSKKNGVS